MKESGLLKIDNPLHKVALHYVYLPRLNRALSSFVSAWNNHPLRTENNWSPERIWVNEMMDLRNHQLMAVADIFYGYDPSAPTLWIMDCPQLKLRMLTLNFQEMLYMILQQLLIHFNSVKQLWDRSLH